MEIKHPNGKISPPNLGVADTDTGLGRGAYSGRQFLSGEVVEVCPVILVDYPFKELPTPVQRIVFNWSKLCDAHEKFALVLGYGSIYNHADHPNLRYSADPDNQTMIYTAVQKIKQGEQLTVSYNQVPEGAEPRKKDWFEANQVAKIEIKNGKNGKEMN